MVVALGPGKFYGNSLPRPRFYTDVKFSDQRVDPPTSVMEPLMQWASEAHWSMGGLSTKRLRLQGKIEGNVEKLRKEREKFVKKRAESLSPIGKSNTGGGGRVDLGFDDSPPPAPISRKRRRFTMVSDDEDEEPQRVKEKEGKAKEAEGGNEDAGVKSGGKVNARKLARKLKDDFDLVADKGSKAKRSPLKEVGNQETVGSRTRRTRTSSETEGVITANEVSTPQNGGKRARDDGSGTRKGSVKEGKYVQSISGSPSIRKSPRLSKIKS